jgi:hypothetical protein
VFECTRKEEEEEDEEDMNRVHVLIQEPPSV